MILAACATEARQRQGVDQPTIEIQRKGKTGGEKHPPAIINLQWVRHRDAKAPAP